MPHDIAGVPAAQYYPLPAEQDTETTVSQVQALEVSIQLCQRDIRGHHGVEKAVAGRVLVIDRHGEGRHQGFATGRIKVGLDPQRLARRHGGGVPGLLLVVVIGAGEVGVLQLAVAAVIVGRETQGRIVRDRRQGDGRAKYCGIDVHRVPQHLRQACVAVIPLLQHPGQQQGRTLKPLQPVFHVDHHRAHGVIGFALQALENGVPRQSIIHQHAQANDDRGTQREQDNQPGGDTAAPGHVLWPARPDYQLPVFAMDCQGSCGGRAAPACSSSMEIPSGERIKAMCPSRGGRLMVMPCSTRCWHSA